MASSTVVLPWQRVRSGPRFTAVVLSTVTCTWSVTGQPFSVAVTLHGPVVPTVMVGVVAPVLHR